MLFLQATYLRYSESFIQAVVAPYVQAAWSRFGKFMAERASLAKCDWLSVRDELWRIEDFLNKWSKGTEGQLAKDPVAVILAREVDSYR